MPVLSYLEHHPQVDDSVFIAPNAYIVGRVTISSASSIWFGSTVRGDSGVVEIGNGVNIQEGCTIHTEAESNAVLGDNVSLGHQAIVHAATVEAGCMIAMNASVLSGAHVGKGSIVAAHALVPEGMAVPSGSLVMGVPGRVVRPVNDAEARRAAHTARVYRELAAQYRSSR